MHAVLGIDASGSALALGVMSPSGMITSILELGYRHNEHLLPEVKRLMDRSGLVPEDLDLIVCTAGPGSFTGLRIAMAAAKGIAFAHRTPMVSVPTLDVLAREHDWYKGPVMPVIDGRKQRFYGSVYESGVPSVEVFDLPARDVYLRSEGFPGVLLCGPGAQELESALKAEHLHLPAHACIRRSQRHVCVNTLIEEGLTRYKRFGGDHTTSGPVYIRPSEAEEHRRGL